MQYRLSLLSQELHVELDQLISAISLIGEQPSPEELSQLELPLELIGNIVGVIAMATQPRDPLFGYVEAIKRLLHKWTTDEKALVVKEKQVALSACLAFQDYLGCAQSDATYSCLGLFSAYGAVCGLLSEACHPIDMWGGKTQEDTLIRLTNEPFSVMLMESAKLRLSKVDEGTQTTHPAQLESIMLSILRRDNMADQGQEVLRLGQTMCDIRICHATSRTVDVLGGTMLRCIFEAMDSGDLDLDIWLKRALLGSLDWLNIKAECSINTLAFFCYLAWQKRCVRLRPQGQLQRLQLSNSDLEALASHSGWDSVSGADYSRPSFLGASHTKTDQLLHFLTKAKKALEDWAAESMPRPADRAILSLVMSPLLEALSSIPSDDESLADELVRVFNSSEDLQSRAILVEVATSFLTLEALASPHTKYAAEQQSSRFSELARRIKFTRDLLEPGAIPPWMLSLHKQKSWSKAIEQLAQEIRLRLVNIEEGFGSEKYAYCISQVQSLVSVASILNWRLFEQAGRSVLADLQRFADLDESQRVAANSALTHNLAAMSLFVDCFSSIGDGALSLFSFDEQRKLLIGRATTTESLPELPSTETEVVLAVPLQNSVEAPKNSTQVEFDEEIVSIFLLEAEELLSDAKKACARLEVMPDDTEQAIGLRRIFHTLKGGSRMAGWQNFAGKAAQTEQSFNEMLSEKLPANDHFLAHVRNAIDQLCDALSQYTDSQIKLDDPAVSVLAKLRQAGLDETNEFNQDQTQETKTIGDVQISLPMFNAYLNEADEYSRQLLAALSEWAIDDTQPLPTGVMLWAHTLAGSSATVGFSSLATLAKTIEQILERIEQEEYNYPNLAKDLVLGAEDVRRLLHQFAVGILKDPDEAISSQLEWLLVQPQVAPAADPEPVSKSLVSAQPDAAKLHEPNLEQSMTSIFQEEASVLLPSLGLALRLWIHSANGNDGPEQRIEALRLLHTLKGSARLVGQTHLADQAHQLETVIESYPEIPSAEQAAKLLSLYDAMELQRGQIPVVAQGVIRTLTHSSVPSQPVALPANSSETIRVKLGLIDQLINDSGEIMIARARMYAEIERSQHTLADMGGQVNRLREQLRELELQTESQMQSRQAQFSDQAHTFDPLELDRFTRTQELTRFMAEALADISTLQRSLLRSLNATEDDLAAQARQSRDLQRHLLQTRMVAFDSVVERLHRLVRITSLELNKPAELSIVGGTQEIDRSVLERVTPAFEHLIRNAIVHGIESKERRSQAGKPDVGLIQIQLVQTGNDVEVTLRDDGGGLDFEAIRNKAAALNKTAANRLNLDDPLALIFISGVSTAQSVSELAGRGIGLDVVRAQVLALGGRIEVQSSPGVGTTFKMVLPLTTAVTHIVMVRMGNVLTALPSNLVQTVIRAKPQEIKAAKLAGQWEIGTAPIPFHTLESLLHYPKRLTESVQPNTSSQASVPSVLILTSSSQSIALFVDEVLGNHEVVVKNLGPQLAQMPGLSGMTVLPTGETVLIYNPVSLAAVYGLHAQGGGEPLEQEAFECVRNASDSERPSGLDTDMPLTLAPLVLVVDDSITMRRVLQRVLLREGFRVAIAADGKQALEALRVELPAMILSDVEMPRMDGFELLKQIRSSERTQQIPVVMITSRIADKHREHAKELGANEYLGKPYSEDELIRVLARYLPKVSP